MPAESKTPRHFHALYYAVLAIGAVTAPDDQQTLEALNHLAGDKASFNVLRNGRPHPAQIADEYFREAKAMLGDVFETSSPETAMALFFMAVYCQNALRAHSCYMYSGMAVRTALALGIPSQTGADNEEVSRLWWALYSHEIEMCASTGRFSALGKPTHYELRPHKASPSIRPAIIEYMVHFADLLGQLSHKLYSQGSSMTVFERSAKSWRISDQLQDWKRRLDNEMGLETTSLFEPSWLAKQKLVLKLRFLNAQILLHRPFLPADSPAASEPPLQDHVKACLSASRRTVALLHDAYLNRPYFRSWWYNTTYLLYATMVILYVVLSEAADLPLRELQDDARMGLAILETMKSNAVANRCATVIKETIEMAEEVTNCRQQQQQVSSCLAGSADLSAPSDAMSGWSFEDDGLLSNLVDTHFLDSLLNFES